MSLKGHCGSPSEELLITDTVSVTNETAVYFGSYKLYYCVIWLMQTLLLVINASSPGITNREKPQIYSSSKKWEVFVT